ncbi:MAG: flagellar motor protein MotB [Synergistaceae bacterium]|nr:flagellar motor protein MotB [Synergistaceae bacterium]
MARKKKAPPAAAGAPLFMATYGDMVTLLLCFFVLLFAMSTIDSQKAQQAVISLRNSLGVMKGGRTLVRDIEPNPTPEASEGRTAGPSVEIRMLDTQHVAHTINSYLRTEGLDKAVQVTVNQRGVQVSISDQFLFDSGSAMLKPDGQRVIYKIATLVRDVVPAIAVEGHTDSVPLRGGMYRDNWGLSAMRAARVASFMQEDGGVESRLLQAVGYGPSRPVVPNDTPAHRALNRRVDIVFLSEYPK